MKVGKGAQVKLDKSSNPTGDNLGFRSNSRPAAAEELLRAQLMSLGTQIHDDVLQVFGTCLLEIQLCERYLEMGHPDLVRKELSLLEDALNHGIDKVRDLVATLNHLPDEYSSR